MTPAITRPSIVRAPSFDGFVLAQGAALPSATRPFLVADEGGRSWVVKVAASSTGTGAGHLVSELLVGLLARFLDVPWPEVAIFHLPDEVLARVRSEGLDPQFPVGIGTCFIQALQPAALSKLRPECYGKAILDLWVGMDDTKPDQVQQRPNGDIVFLDGESSEITRLLDADQSERVTQEAGIVALHPDPHHPCLSYPGYDETNFSPWLGRIRRFSSEHANQLGQCVPQCLGIPEKMICSLKDFLLTRSLRMPEAFTCETAQE